MWTLQRPTSNSQQHHNGNNSNGNSIVVVNKELVMAGKSFTLQRFSQHHRDPTTVNHR